MMRYRYSRMCTTLGVAVALGGCAGPLFQYGLRPRELAGTWVDLAHTTATDTTAWVLRSDGYDGTLHITVDTAASAARAGQPRVTRQETRFGSWYLDGAITDTAHRAICYKRRAREGSTCVRFRLDTLAAQSARAARDSAASASRTRRQLTLFGYVGRHHTGTRVLVERIP